MNTPKAMTRLNRQLFSLVDAGVLDHKSQSRWILFHSALVFALVKCVKGVILWQSCFTPLFPARAPMRTRHVTQEPHSDTCFQGLHFIGRYCADKIGLLSLLPRDSAEILIE